jgi:iron(III) transport system permease protein
VLAVIVAILVGLPVLNLILGSLRAGGPLEGGAWTLRNYTKTLSDPFTLRLIANTLIFSVGQTALPLVLGVMLAWLLTRTNLPWKRVWEYATLGLYFVPLLVAATAWTILLGRNNGVLNVAWHHLTGGRGFDVFSMAGMILIQSLYLVPLVFLVVSASFRSVNPELEEASRTAAPGPRHGRPSCA